MLFKLFLLFTIVPALELYILVSVGSKIGFLATISIIIFTGVLGAYLAKTQGIITLQKVFRELQQGQLPAEELLNALIIVIAGVVLITPGFITDIIGFLLLIPMTRRVIFRFLKIRLEAHLHPKNSDGVIEISAEKQDDE